MAGEAADGWSSEDVDHEALRAAGLTAFQIARRLLRMVALFHEQGHESLYIYCDLAGGCIGWNFEIGAMDGGIWPRPQIEQLHEDGWLGDGVGHIGFALLEDDAGTMAEKFRAMHSDILDAARTPNAAYAAWFRQMLALTEPLGMLIFWHEYQDDQFPSAMQPGPDFTDVRLPMPPGFRDWDGRTH